MSEQMTISPALEAANRAIQECADQADALILAKVQALMMGYDARWHGDDWEVVAVEREYELPLVNPETGRPSQTWRHAGKLDLELTWTPDGSFWVGEHKTTSESIDDPNAPYWQRLTIDSQVNEYVLAQWQQGVRPAGTLYDVIKKPTIRPRKLTKAEVGEIVGSGLYFGFFVPEGTREGVTGGKITAEDPDLFYLRLARDTINEPDKYFQRRPIPRLQGEVLEYAHELWDIGKAMQHARKAGHYYRNTGACMMYGRPCKFLGVCSGHEGDEVGAWRRNPERHKPGVLSNSRIRTFMTCNRKYQYEYELGLEKPDEEEQEALVFGSVMHRALEAWWLTFKPQKEENDHGNGNSTGSTASARTPATANACE